MCNDYRELVVRTRNRQAAQDLAKVINTELILQSPSCSSAFLSPTVCVLIQILSLLVSSTGEWCKPHPHDSFAPVRTAQGARWLVDGANYFGAVADAIMGARRTIYIADWWLSPEVGAFRLEFPLGDWR